MENIYLLDSLRMQLLSARSVDDWDEVDKLFEMICELELACGEYYSAQLNSV